MKDGVGRWWRRARLAGRLILTATGKAQGRVAVHAPVIVITAAAREARHRAESNVEVVVPKPFSVDRVLALVNRYTGRDPVT